MALISSPVPLDNREVARRIKDWLDKKGFETKAFEADGSYFLKTRKSSGLRSVVGADRALEIGIRHSDNQTQVEVRQGSWKTNIVSNAGWFLVTGGANLLFSGWSLVIQKDLESYIRTIFNDMGMKEVAL